MAPRRRFHHLSPPSKDAKRRVLRVKLPGPLRLPGCHREPKIGLRPGHHPLQLRNRLPRRRLSAPWQTNLASILDATPAAVFHSDFKLQIEILGLEPVERNIAVRDRLFLGRFADDRSVFHVPDIRITVPAFEADAIEDLHVTLMVIKVERLRLIKTILPLDSLVGLQTCGATRLLTGDSGSLGNGFGHSVFGCRCPSREPHNHHGEDRSDRARRKPPSLEDRHADALSLPVLSSLSFINFRPSLGLKPIIVPTPNPMKLMRNHHTVTILYVAAVEFVCHILER